MSILRWAEYEINWHWILKDGLSGSDHSVLINSIVDMFPNGRVTLIAQPDDGIYQAMNQAIPYLKEDDYYCLFLNSGDEFSDQLCHNWKSIRSKFINTDLFYGDHWVRQGTSIKRSSAPSQIDWGYLVAKMINHQSIWIKSRLVKKYQFITDYKVVADWVQLFTIMRNENIESQYFPLPFVTYQGGGYSELHDEKRIHERRAFLTSLYSDWELVDITTLSRFRVRPWYHFVKRALNSPLRSKFLNFFNKIDSIVQP